MRYSFEAVAEAVMASAAVTVLEAVACVLRQQGTFVSAPTVVGAEAVVAVVSDDGRKASVYAAVGGPRPGSPDGYCVNLELLQNSSGVAVVSDDVLWDALRATGHPGYVW